MAKQRKKKSGVILLRVQPELHEDLALVAGELGLDVTLLIRLMIRRSLEHFRFEAHVLATMAKEGEATFAHWRQENPQRPIREYLDYHFLIQATQWAEQRKSFRFDPRYGMAEAYVAPRLEPTSTRSEAKKEEES